MMSIWGVGSNRLKVVGSLNRYSHSHAVQSPSMPNTLAYD